MALQDEDRSTLLMGIRQKRAGHANKYGCSRRPPKAEGEIRRSRAAASRRPLTAEVESDRPCAEAPESQRPFTADSEIPRQRSLGRDVGQELGNSGKESLVQVAPGSELIPGLKQVLPADSTSTLAPFCCNSEKQTKTPLHRRILEGARQTAASMFAVPPPKPPPRRPSAGRRPSQDPGPPSKLEQFVDDVLSGGYGMRELLKKHSCRSSRASTRVSDSNRVSEDSYASPTEDKEREVNAPASLTEVRRGSASRGKKLVARLSKQFDDFCEETAGDGAARIHSDSTANSESTSIAMHSAIRSSESTDLPVVSAADLAWFASAPASFSLGLADTSRRSSRNSSRRHSAKGAPNDTQDVHRNTIAADAPTLDTACPLEQSERRCSGKLPKPRVSFNRVKSSGASEDDAQRKQSLAPGAQNDGSRRASRHTSKESTATDSLLRRASSKDPLSREVCGSANSTADSESQVMRRQSKMWDVSSPDSVEEQDIEEEEEEERNVLEADSPNMSCNTIEAKAEIVEKLMGQVIQAWAHSTDHSLPEEDLREMIRVFATFDKDGSGSIAIHELRSLLRYVGQQTTPMKIYQIVSKYDSDASGEIDICEYLNFMQEFKAEENEAMRQKFQELDEDDSGELGLAELELALLSLGRDPTKEQMKEMLATFDTDGSLTFSFEEFRGMVQLLAEMEKKLAYDNAGFSEEELEGIREQFLHHDKDRSGELSFNELVGVIADLGLLPRTKEQQKRLVEKMNSLDSDGSGQLSFGEFVHLFRRFLDEAESLEFDKERIAATEIGLSPNELDDFRAAYDQSLTDLGGGVMDFTVSSTRTFLRMAGIQLSPQEMAELKTIFNKYAVEVGRNDNKDSPVAHSLPFPAFLRFVGHILSINFACIADRTERIVEKSLEDSTKLTLLISKVEEQKDKVQRSRDSATSERRPSHTRLPQI